MMTAPWLLIFMALANLFFASLGSVGALHTSPVRAFFEEYFPCLSLLVAKPTWQTTYYDNSILSSDKQLTTYEEVAKSAERYDAMCNRILFSTNHTLICSPNRYIVEPPNEPKFIILFLQGLTFRDQIGAYLPFLARVLVNSPELASSVRIVYPFSPLRSITFSDVLDPPITIGRAWFDIYRIGTTVKEFLASSVDRLGLYRAAEQIDFMVRSQRCQSSVSTRRLIVMGHSNGAAASLEWALSTDLQPAGVLAISGALPRPQDYLIPNVQAFNPVRRGFRVTMIHGTADPIIMFAGAKATAEPARRAVESTGGNFEFVGLKDLDHFSNLTMSPTFYSAINRALKEGFLDRM